MVTNGFITLHRKIITSNVFDDAELLKVWIWCLIRANHKDTEVAHAKQIVKLKRGEFITGTYSGSKELRMSPKVFRNRIKSLVMLRQIEQKGASKFSIISVIKYDFYQTKEKERASKGQAKGKQRATDNNVNNVNNIGEPSSPTDMGWKQYNENAHHEELPLVDSETGSVIDPDEKKKNENKEQNEKKKALVDWLIESQGRDPLKTNRPKQLKALNELIKMQVTAKEAVAMIKEQESSDYWRSKKEKPDFSTVVSLVQKRG